MNSWLKVVKISNGSLKLPPCVDLDVFAFILCSFSFMFWQHNKRAVKLLSYPFVIKPMFQSIYHIYYWYCKLYKMMNQIIWLHYPRSHLAVMDYLHYMLHCTQLLKIISKFICNARRVPSAPLLYIRPRQSSIVFHVSSECHWHPFQNVLHHIRSKLLHVHCKYTF